MSRVMDRVDQRQLEDAGRRWWEAKGADEEDPEPGRCIYCSGVGCPDCGQRGAAAVALVLAGCIVGALLALAFLVVAQPLVCSMHDASGPRYCQEASR